MKRGRKSSAGNVVQLVPTPRRPLRSPPKCLTKDEATLFTELLTAAPHLNGYKELLTLYVQAFTRTYKLGKQTYTQEYERSLRLMLALARSLRLTPQAAVSPRSAGSARERAQMGDAANQLRDYRADDE